MVTAASQYFSDKGLQVDEPLFGGWLGELADCKSLWRELTANSLQEQATGNQ